MDLMVAVREMDCEELTKNIRIIMRRTAKDAVQLGFMLRRVRDEELYKPRYKNLKDYLRSELDMDYTLASRYMAINKKYSILGNSMEIRPRYQEYSQGALIEMLNMETELEEKVTPDMPVREIRKIKPPSKGKRKRRSWKGGEIIIDGEYREMPEHAAEEVATSQLERIVAENGGSGAADGLSRTEYPESSAHQVRNCGYRCRRSKEPEESSKKAKLPEPPVLTRQNRSVYPDQCAEWMKTYKDWGLWYRDEHINVDYYEYEFWDGSRLVVAEYPQRRSDDGEMRDDAYVHLIEKNKLGGDGARYDDKFRYHSNSKWDVADFLENLQKRGRKECERK